MTGYEGLEIVPLDATRIAEWSDLFARCGCSCYCRWWHFMGSKNEWLARCAHQPQRNRDEQLELIAHGAIEGRGLVALDRGKGIAWMKLVPRGALPKLLSQGAYRALRLQSQPGVWSIGCLLVDPARRRRGVARSLVVASVSQVAAWGGTAVEAYPRRADAHLHDEEAWMGTDALYASCGFRQVAGEGPYPVMRRELGVQPMTSPADSSFPSRTS